MASSFLKKKAEERAKLVDEQYGADAYGGSNWRSEQSKTTKSSGGNSAAGAKTADTTKKSNTGDTQKKTTGSTGSTGTKKASSFLQQRASERAAEVDRQYGADAYGGSQWRERGGKSYEDTSRKALTDKQRSYIDDYRSRTYEDNFLGQFQANRALGRIGQDTDAAYNEYLKNPTEENRVYAEAMNLLEQQFMRQNAAALDDEGAVLPWISKSAANYLPQLWDQTKAQVVGGAVGAGGGALAGSVIPGAGTIAGAVMGAKAGAVAGSGYYSYNQMRGAAFQELLAAGIDEDTAREAASDEGVVSGLIEMADTAFDIATLGTGKLLSLLGKGGAKAVAGEAAEGAAKRVIKGLAGYGINIAGEMAEEASQEAVSIYNQQRVQNGDTGNAWDLAKGAAGTAWDAIKGDNADDANQIWEAAKEGGKIAAMFGGATRAVTGITNTAITTKTGADMKDMGGDVVQAVIDEGLASAENTESRQLAEKLAAKQKAGQEITSHEVGVLYEANKRAIQAEEAAQATQSAQETLENLARETVAQRENGQQAQATAQEQSATRNAVPYNVMSEQNPVRKQRIQQAKNLQKTLGYGEKGMEAFNSILEESGQSIEQVRSRFQSAYEAGMTNLPRERVQLLDNVQETAYNAGRMDAILSMKKAETKGATVYGKDGGLIQNDYSAKLDDTTADTLQKIGKATGTKIIVKEQVYDGLANGSYENGTVTIASDAENPYIVVAKHEVTHRMQELAPKQYAAYRDYAVQLMAGDSGSTTLVERYQNRAANSGVSLSTEKAMDEIAADFTENILTDEQALNDFVSHVTEVREHRTMGQKFFQAVRDFIDKVKRIFKGDRKKMDAAAEDQYGATIDQLEKAEALWKEAYRAAEEKAQSTEVTESVTHEGVVQHSLKITDPALLKFLNDQIAKGEYDPLTNPDGGYIKVYRSFQVIDGKLYAPMNAVDRDANGKNKRLGYNSQYGVWEMATESPEIAQRYMDAHPDAPYAKFDLDGVDNATGGVAYNPYLHASNLVLNDQFSAAYRRNLVTVECYVPISEANGAYRAQYAKDATGWVEWKPGGVAGKLMKKKPEYTRKLFVSRYMLPVREVKSPEVASMYKEYLDGTGIKVPWNVVTPELRRELVKAGVPIDYDKDVYQSTDKKTGVKKYARFDEVFPGERQTQYSLKGEKANLSAEDKAALHSAKQMKKAGKSNEEIYKETGWYTQSDGMWRTEFATSAMQSAKAFNSFGLDFAVESRVNKYEEGLRDFVEDGVYTEDDVRSEVETYKKRLAENGIGSGLLSEFYDDEELYTAYPFLRDVRLTFRRPLNKKNSFVTKYAEYSPDGEIISVDRNACIDDGVNVRGVLLHEIQHIIQRYEGFSKGTSLKAAGSFSAYESTGGEIEARDVERRMRMTSEERRNNMPVQFSLKTDGDIQTVTDKDGEVVAETRKDGTTLFSLKTFKDGGRAYLQEWLGKKVKSKDITQADADDIISQMDEFYDLCQNFTGKYGPFGAWSKAEVVTGSDGKPAFSVVKNNGEYAMNLDFSLVCKKRRTLDAVFREMINRGTMDSVELGEEQISKINAIIRESGFETACALCFVDSKRYRQAMVADNFVNQYNELVEMLVPDGSDIRAHRFDFLERGVKDSGRALHTVPDSELGKGILKLKKVMQNEPSNKTVRYKIASHLLNNPQDRKLVMRSEFMNTDGFEAVTVKNRKVLGLYNSSKGSGGPKASLSDVQYLGDILKKNNFTPAKAYAVGGVRIQSFSDYMPRLVFDYLQMIADLSAKKLPAHAYTKVEMFAKQFGMTGIKINLSLVPAVDPDGVAPGLDAKGNYIWYDGQSFGSDVNVKGSGQTGFKTAVEIQNAAGYSANCGTIAVGISDQQIWKMLDDDDIRMVIPYHKSSLNHIVAVLNNIDQYTDYTGVQNTRSKATGSKITGKDFNFNDALRRLGDAKEAADAYLEWCDEHDYIPKFDTFAGHENYYKLLEDFSTYDNGESAPQGAVQMVFPGKDSAFGSMAELIERGLEEDAILEGRRQSDVPKIVDRIEEVYRSGGMQNGAQFSLKGQQDLMRENAKLKEVNRELREQFKTTKFAKVDRKALDTFTKQLLKDYKSGADINEIRDALDDLFTYIANGENGESAVWEEAYSRAYEASVSVLSAASTLNDELYREYKGLRDYLRTTRISIDKQYDHDLDGYESISEFRKANFGRINIANDGIPVDVVYEELSYTYPEFFDSDAITHPAEQLSHIEEVLDNLQPYEENPYTQNMRESATWLANDIMERFFELPQAKPTFADKAQRKLTKQAIRDAEKLERLREQKNAKIASLIEENREKVKTVTQKERDNREQGIRKVKEHYQEKEAKASESRKARELRARIIRHTQDMSQKLLRPSDKQHIPEELRGAVAELLDAINLESQYTIDPITGKRQKGGDGDPTRRTAAFDRLRMTYQKIIQEDSADIVVDPAIEAMLDKVTSMRDVKLADMKYSQLADLWQIVRVVEHTINYAGKILSNTKYERTVEWANAMQNDTATRRTLKGRRSEGFRLDMENPYTFFSHYGESGKAVYRMLRDAQDKQQVMVNRVADAVSEIVDPKTVRKLEKEIHTFTTERGDKLTLTKAQIMDIYLLTKREQAQDHLLKGGIVQPEIESKHIKRGTDAILLTSNDLYAITGKMTVKEREIAIKLQNMTSTMLADYGNQASMQAYGYKKFTGSDYWPIKSASEGIRSNVEKGGNNTRSIKNIGLAKTVMPFANNPLDIAGIFKTFANHAGDMTDYAAWLCPMEDANRLFNFQFRDEDGNRTGKTIKGLLDRVGGKGAQQYWHRLMEDIQNGIKSANDTSVMGPINRIIGNVKGAAVGANIRVVIQQPTAIFRAAAVLSPGDMVKGMVAGGGWKKALQHSPIAMRKDMGGFDISSPMQMNEILFDDKTKLRRFNDSMAAPAGAADAVTWGRIWNACEWATKRKHPDLQPRTDAFYAAVNELFTEVIDQSQVVDGVLQRSQIMRSSNALVTQATAFMGEPIMSMNMLIRAYDGLRNEQNAKKRGKAIKTFGRAAIVLMVTNTVNALAQSLVDAARDDEDDDYWDKFWAAFTGITGEEETAWDKATAAVLSGNLGGNMNPIGNIPFAKDILSILQGYNVTRADADVMGDIISAVETFIDSVSGDGKKTIGYATKNLAQQVGKVFGVSAPNILRDVWGIVRTVALETGNIPLQYEMEKAIYKIDNDGNVSRFVDILYKAYNSDMEVYQHIYEDMASSGFNMDKLQNQMEKRMKDEQGVTKVSELESRYLHPDQQSAYDSKLETIQRSSAWKAASEDQRGELKDTLYDLVTENSAGQKLKETIADGKDYGLDETEYLLYTLALEMADQPNENGNLGTYSNKEKAEAISSLDLGDSEIAYLWGTDQAFEAYAYGISMDKYVAFKANEGDIKADKDENGKTISGSRKEKIIDYLNTLGLTYEEYLYLLGTEYDSVKKEADYISFFGQ